MGTKNRTREDGAGIGLVGIDPFAYFMRGYESVPVKMVGSPKGGG